MEEAPKIDFIVVEPASEARCWILWVLYPQEVHFLLFQFSVPGPADVIQSPDSPNPRD